MILADVASPDAKFREESWAILPVGAIEQHAKHLPLGTDLLLVSAIADALEAAAPDRIVRLPSVPYGASDHHADRPGTVSVGSLALTNFLREIVAGLIESSDIRRALIVNGHGGNSPAMAITIEGLKRTYSDRLFWGLSYWDAIFDQLGSMSPAPMGHADHIETSMMLYVRPETVSGSRADDYYLKRRPAWLRTSESLPSLTAIGGVGNSSKASAPDGEVYLNAAVAGILAVLDLA